MAKDNDRPSALERLRRAWADKYAIAEIDGEFQATRREGHNRSPVLRSSTVAGLHSEIVTDFGANGAPKALSADGYRNGITSSPEPAPMPAGPEAVNRPHRRGGGHGCP